MKRTAALLGLLCALVGALVVAWKGGYFDTLTPKPRTYAGAIQVKPPEPWEVDLARQLSDVQPLVSASLLRGAPQSLAQVQFPVGKAIHLQAEANRRHYEFLMREIDAYRQRTHDSADAQAAAVAFLEATFGRTADVDDAASVPRIRELGAAAVEAGSTDPYVLFQVADYSGPVWEQKIQLASDALLKNSPSLRWRLDAHDSQLRAYRASKSPSGLDPVKLVLEDLVEWSKTCGDDPIQQSLIFGTSRYLWKGQSPHYFQQVYETLARVDAAPPWLRHMIAGAYRLELAWQYRGRGWASEVSDENGKHYTEELEKAARHLSYAWHLHPERHQPAVLMISVTLGGVSDQYGTSATWFQRAIDARFDAYDAYERYRSTLEPRWGGSFEEMIALARASLLTGRYDTSVPQQALNTLFVIQSADLGQSIKVTSRADARSLLQLYIDGHAKAVTEAQDTKAPIRPLASASAAALCVQARRFADARKLLAGSEDPIPQLKRELARLWEPSVLGAAAVFASADDEELVLDMFSRMRGGFDSARPREELEALRDRLANAQATAQEPRALPFFQHANTLVKRALAYQTGEWVPLTFEEEGAGWAFSAPDWRIVDDKTLWMSNTRTAGKSVMQADLLNRVPLPFVVEFDCVPKGSTGPIGIIGAMVGTREIEAVESTFINSRFFGVDDSPRAVMVTSHRDAGVNLGVNLQAAPPYRIRVKCWPQWYTILVNGFRYMDQADPSFNPVPMVSFGSGFVFDNVYQLGEVTLSNIRIRKLNSIPPPTDVVDGNVAGYLKNQEEYFRKELQADPEDGWAMYLHGRALFFLDRPTEAQPLLEDALRRVPRLRDEGVNTLIARCFRERHLYAEAIALFRQDLARQEDIESSLVELSRTLSCCPDEKFRDGKEALRLAQLACDKKDSDWTALLAKAAAQAELGEFEQALLSLDAAEKRTTKTTSKTNQRVIADHRTAFKDKRPYRFATSGEAP